MHKDLRSGTCQLADQAHADSALADKIDVVLVNQTQGKDHHVPELHETGDGHVRSAR